MDTPVIDAEAAAKGAGAADGAVPAYWRRIVCWLLVLLMLAPLAAAMWGSLSDTSPSGPYGQIWSLGKGPRQVLASRGVEALWTTFKLGSMAAAVAVLLALCMARFVSRLSAALSTIVALLSCLPLLLPSSLLASAWIVAAGKQGLLNPLLQTLFGSSWTVFSFSGACFVLATRYFGIAVLIFHYDQLRRRGDWPINAVFPLGLAASLRCHLARLLPRVALAWVIVLLMCMNDHVIPDMLLVSTYGSLILILYSAMLDLAGAAAMSVPVAVLATVVLLLALRMGRRLWAADQPALTHQPPQYDLLSRTVSLLGATAILGVALGVPLAVLIGRTPSLNALRDAIAGSADGSLIGAAPQAWQTLKLACIAGTMTAVAGAAVASTWRRCNLCRIVSPAPLAMLNVAVPPSLLAIGMVQLNNLLPCELHNTIWPLVAAYVVRFAPLIVLVLYMQWREEDELPVAAARVHALSSASIAARIQLPRRAGSLVGAMLLSMLLIATEMELSTMLSPPGRATLGVRLGTLMHTASDAAVSALAIDILMMVMPVILVLLVLMVRRRKRSENPWLNV